MTQQRRRSWLALLLVVGILPFELNGWYNPLLSYKAFWCVEIFTWIMMPLVLVVIALRMRLITSVATGDIQNAGS